MRRSVVVVAALSSLLSALVLSAPSRADGPGSVVANGGGTICLPPDFPPGVLAEERVLGFSITQGAPGGDVVSLDFRVTEFSPPPPPALFGPPRPAFGAPPPPP